MTSAPSRNASCPCGSGKKYKHCCEGKASHRSSRFAATAGLALLVLMGLIAVGVAISSGGGGGSESARNCPPGQVWSAEHNHCH